MHQVRKNPRGTLFLYIKSLLIKPQIVHLDLLQPHHIEIIY